MHNDKSTHEIQMNHVYIKATGNSRSGIPGNPPLQKFPAGIPGNFWILAKNSDSS